MTKDVLISISGFLFQQEDGTNQIESITKGDYYKKEHSHFVLFEEVTEGSDETIKNIIKFSDNTVSVTKKGLINVNMLFEENKKNMSNYVTPYGNILIGLDTRRVDMTEEENRILVQVDYALEANYEHLADCQLVMDIRNKEEGFTL